MAVDNTQVSSNRASLTALFINFKHNIQELIEITDFAIVTWLAIGASIQLLSQAWLPPTLGYWLPLGYLIYKVARSAYDCTSIFRRNFTTVKSGRWTTTLPEPNESALTTTDDGVVMFVLGARINHPLGKLAPGCAEIDTMFKDMWKEARQNREKYSYLGKTATLFDISDGEGTTVFWLSYWKDLKGLQAFATSNVHRTGQNAYNKKDFPWIGIMHETYHSPRGHWECIYDEMPPTGMGAIEPLVSKRADGFKVVDALIPNPRGSTMFSRMRRTSVKT